MIQINTINIFANLDYFKTYLQDNYTFTNFIVNNDSILLEFETTPNTTEELSIIDYYNNIVELDWLDDYKKQKFEQINDNTQILINNGYSYSGYQFPLTDNAQTNILALYTTKDDPVLIYPIIFNTIDDSETFEAIDSTIISNMYYTALATKKNHLDTATTLKDQIRNATSKSQVDSIII